MDDFLSLEVRPSDYGRSRAGSHVHDISCVLSGPTHYFAKAEKACIKLPSPRTESYDSFGSFVESLFNGMEGRSPSRTFSFEDDPEISPLTLHESDFQDVDVSAIHDTMDPALISLPAVRAAFILYLGRKESLEGPEKTYLNVFNHHGRDIICEYLSFATGRLLGVPIPRIFPGLRKESNREVRYVLSRSLGQRPAELSGELSHLLIEKQDPDLARQVRRSQGWPNPLGIRARENNWPAEIPELLLADFPHHTDLIRSDVLDIILSCDADRKLEEFLLPRGRSGPIYTVDYGEAFYSELQFAPDDGHLLARLAEHKSRLKHLLMSIKERPRSPVEERYAGIAHETLTAFAGIKLDFFRQILHGFPQIFFHYESSSPRLALRAETLTFVLMQLGQLCRKHL